MTRNVSVDTGPSRYTQNTSIAAALGIQERLPNLPRKLDLLAKGDALHQPVCKRSWHYPRFDK